jgi:DNA-binding winged helix-turn-helix (wHTH) protein/tetratricopeptide (TPR) repeat protein
VVPEVYEFGEFTLNASERRFSRGDQVVPLEPKAHDVLVALVRAGGHLVTKRELLELVWPESFVEEGILAVHISALRKALGESGRQCIETVPRTGYRFAVATRRIQEDDVAPGLKRWSVAVLPAQPFAPEILSGRDQSARLAIADALIDRLGRCEQIIVRPTRAIRPYMERADDPATIGRSLRVDAVVDSHFLGTADRLRISVHLIRSQDGASLWTGKFDEPAADILTLADVVADCVAAHVTSNAPGTVKRIAPPSPADPGVYELIGRGRFYLLSYSMFEISKALEAFRAAIELDPTYAPAHAGLALACCSQAALRVVAPAEAYQEAGAAALRALAMDDACADAQVALGSVLFFSEWNWEGAERSLKRALHLNPNHSEAYLVYGQLLDTLGRPEEGLSAKLKALERDPFSPLVHLQISLSYWNQRRYDSAIEWANKTLELDPRHPHAREHLAAAYWKKGDSEHFIAESLKHAELHGVPAEALEHFKQIYTAEGRLGMTKLALQRASSQPQAFPAMQLALFHGEMGNMDLAFQHLECAIASHDPGLVHLAVGPQWDILRVDPRFNQCLSKMGLQNQAAVRIEGSSSGLIRRSREIPGS